MANPIAKNGTHERRETYANEVLAMAKSKVNIYEDFSTDYEIDGATGQINPLNTFTCHPVWPSSPLSYL